MPRPSHADSKGVEEMVKQVPNGEGDPIAGVKRGRREDFVQPSQRYTSKLRFVES